MSDTPKRRTAEEEEEEQNDSIQHPTLIIDGEDGDSPDDGSFKSDPDVIAALVSLGASMAAVDVATPESKKRSAVTVDDTIQSEEDREEDSSTTAQIPKCENEQEEQDNDEGQQQQEVVQLIDEPVVVNVGDTGIGDDPVHIDLDHTQKEEEELVPAIEESVVMEKEDSDQEVCAVIDEPVVLLEDSIIHHDDTNEVCAVIDEENEVGAALKDTKDEHDPAAAVVTDHTVAAIEESVVMEKEDSDQEVCAVIDEPVVLLEDSIIHHDATNEVCAVTEEPPVILLEDDDDDDNEANEIGAALVETKGEHDPAAAVAMDHAVIEEAHTVNNPITMEKDTSTLFPALLGDDDHDDNCVMQEEQLKMVEKSMEKEEIPTDNNYTPRKTQEEEEERKEVEPMEVEKFETKNDTNNGIIEDSPSTANEKGQTLREVSKEENKPIEQEDEEESSTVNEEDEESTLDDDEEEDPMPLFKYSRLLGSLPRLPKNMGNQKGTNAFTSASTCVSLGRVVLLPEASTDAPSSGGTATTAASSTTTASSTQPDGGSSSTNDGSGGGGSYNTKGEPNNSTDASFLRQHYIMAMGFENGQVHLVDMNGNALVPHEQLAVKEWSISYQRQKEGRAIVDLCFDASGSHLVAINESGACAVWDFDWISSDKKNAASNSAASSADESVLRFLGMSGGGASSSANSGGTNRQTPSSSSSSTMITATSVQVSRVTYPSSFGSPICCVIDPSYKRRREKAVLVGFNDGRLILTKKGFFSRRNDSIIYQGTAGAILGLAWRGQLLAWADGAGLRLFDVETMSRIATIDRPSGARVSLYPALSSLKPTIYFETSHDLLCAWGDCVLKISIKEQTITKGASAGAVTSPSGGAAGGGNPDQVVRKRHVECTMAWELDCVACGVAPLDEEHLVILGLVMPETQDDEDGISSEEQQHVSLMPVSSQTPGVNLELQVISRSSGTVQHSDQLPLLKIPGSANMSEAGAGYSLLSSFVLPRMDDVVEAEEESYLQPEQPDFEFQMTFFSGNETPTTFKDPHLKWNLSELSFDDDEEDDNGAVDGTEESNDSDAQSVDSDDYCFLFRPPKVNQRTSTSTTTNVSPPIMVIASFSDAVVARTRDIDDAVDHAFSCGKNALALKRGLQYKRELRRYDIDDLANEYLDALLRRNAADNDEDSEDKKEEDHKGTLSESVSIRRLRLAARALPILLGGNIPAWIEWISIFSDYPGAPFVVKDYVPVRDPKLPSHVYEGLLEKMLLEVESMITSNLKNDSESLRLYQEAKDHFLNAVVAWGSTHTIRKHIKYYTYQDGGQRRMRRLGESIPHPRLAPTEQGLLRRMNQTAAGYLLRGAPQLLPTTPHDVPLLDAEDDSLYDVDMVLSGFSSLVPMLLSPDERIGMDDIAPEKTNTHVALEALAELYIEKHMYERAFQCYLIIGSMHSAFDMSDVIKDAISDVNNISVGDADKADNKLPVQHRQYMNVIALIEYQNLHRCLLEEDFIYSEQQMESSSTVLSPPLIAFIGLVGLDTAAEFLIEHCAPAIPKPTRSGAPGGTLFYNQSSKSSTTLPINLVADGLRSKPQLLHWYLDLMFKRKPELYVKFTNTFVPPAEIRELHRTHLDLYVEYANEFKDSAIFLSTMKSSSTVEELETPLLNFLKALLPLGGVRPDDVKRLLEAKRAGKEGGLVEILEQRKEYNTQVKFQSMFALELAYIMEHFGKDEDVNIQLVDGTEGSAREVEAKQILMLYLEGAKSLPQAVFYAQRNTNHSSQLWEILVDHCLKNQRPAPTTPSRRQRKDPTESVSDTSGTLFGSLLEAAAQSGADLARLVKEIPQGMPVEGLRPRLVGAVADYRWKLQMHQASAGILSADKVALLRELNNRTRRGVRFRQQQVPRNSNQNEEEKVGKGENEKDSSGNPMMWLGQSASASPGRQNGVESKIQCNFDKEHPSPQETSPDSKQLVLRRPVERVAPNRTPFSLPVR